MIKKIKIHKLATYTTPVEMHPLKVNFCFGSNGSGKSTLSNLLGEYETSSGSEIVWESDNQLPVLVYNKRFIEDVFDENKAISGIFTLGKDSKEAHDFIKEQRIKIGQHSDLIQNYTKSKKGMIDEIEKLNTNLEDDCWKTQQKIGEKYSKALTGFRKSKKVFYEKCLQEYPDMNEENPPLIKDIEQLYKVAFGEARETYSTLSLIDIDELKRSEECYLLGQRISGSSNTPVGKFIEYLENSDWIKQGIEYAKKANGKCPYCQQSLSSDVQSDIEAFFDESYEKDYAAVKAFQDKYEGSFSALIKKLSTIVDNPLPILSYELFNAELVAFEKTVEGNKTKIQNKVISPANAVSIGSLEPIALRINKIIDEYNSKITRNNDIVKNQEEEQIRCRKMLWQYITYDLRSLIHKHQTEIKGKIDGITSLNKKIEEQTDGKTACEELIAKKEETITTVIPTANAINSILKRFGFEGFSLAENIDEKGTYKIIRQDNSNARNTLSEGEYNFVNFLYFFHLVYGSQEKKGIEADKVVVIDDPVSSLDSNVLFIISTLVRTIIKNCYNDEKGIKQVFIMTHNIYFHKEVSYWGSRETPSPKLVTYWIVKKVSNVSDIINHGNNPIQTSYELLWDELHEVDSTSRITIFNTLRRILEYYFNIIGGLEYDKCIDLFDDEDKIVCKALISCINDGSHFISDDFVMCYESGAMENYLRVFKLIFEKLEHGNHYEMMMARSTKVPINKAM